MKKVISLLLAIIIAWSMYTGPPWPAEAVAYLDDSRYTETAARSEASFDEKNNQVT